MPEHTRFRHKIRALRAQTTYIYIYIYIYIMLYLYNVALHMIYNILEVFWPMPAESVVPVPPGSRSERGVVVFGMGIGVSIILYNIM